MITWKVHQYPNPRYASHTAWIGDNQVESIQEDKVAGIFRFGRCNPTKTREGSLLKMLTSYRRGIVKARREMKHLQDLIDAEIRNLDAVATTEGATDA